MSELPTRVTALEVEARNASQRLTREINTLKRANAVLSKQVAGLTQKLNQRMPTWAEHQAVMARLNVLEQRMPGLRG